MSNYQPIVYPPLGSVTVLKSGQEITVRAYIPKERGENLSAELWSNINHDEWDGLSMVRIPLQEDEFLSTYVAFEVTVESNSLRAATNFEYTVRYKANTDEVWNWAGHKDANSKVFVSAELEPEELEVESLFEVEQLPDWKFNKIRKNVWSLEIMAEFSSEIQQFTIGNIRSLVQWVGLKRRGLYWLEPLTGLRDLNLFEFDVQYLLWQRRDGSFGVLIPIADESCSTALRSSKSGKIELSVINDTKGTTKAKVLLSFGSDPFKVTQNCMKGAKAMFNSVDDPGVCTSGWYEKLYHRLGYCTWNAYYTDISHEKLAELVDSLKNSKIPVSYLIIDDGWLNISPSAQLKTMSADPNKFPQGLKGIISQIKEEYPNIQDVGVWHTLWGYWGGISPNDEIGHEYKTVQVELRNGGTVPLIHASDIERFFDDYHRYLRDQGVTLVKVDAQSSFDAIRFQSNEDENPRTWWKAYQEALKKSTDKYFGGKVIYCMAQSPRLLFQQINRHEQEGFAVFRNSDDYFPDAPQEAQPWHIYTNTLNNLWISQFPIRPDWDMFQSSHPFAQFHGAARTMNSGPIYITDHVDRFELEVIQALVDDADGRVLSSKSPGLPGRNEIFIDPTKQDLALKVWHINKNVGVSTIGVFNCRPKAIVGTFRLLDVPGDHEKGRGYPTDLIVYLTKKRRVVRLNKGAAIHYISVELNQREFEIAAYYRLLHVQSDLAVVCLGLLGKYCSAAAIARHYVQQAELEGSAPIYHVELQVKTGQIGVYVEHLSKYLDKQSVKVRWNGRQVKRSKLEYDHRNSLLIAKLCDLNLDTDPDTQPASPSTKLQIWFTTA